MAKTIDLSKSLEEIIKEEKKSKKMSRPGDAKWKNKKTKNRENFKNKNHDVFIKRKQIFIKGRERKEKNQTVRPEQHKKIFKSGLILVSNIANGIKIEELRRLFESIGQLKKCEYDKNEEGKPLGSARVCFVKPEDAKRAIKNFDQSELDGRLLCMKLLESNQNE